MEASCQIDLSPVIDAEPVAPSIVEEPEKIDGCQERIRFGRGFLLGIILSVPLWILALWIVL